MLFTDYVPLIHGQRQNSFVGLTSGRMFALLATTAALLDATTRPAVSSSSTGHPRATRLQLCDRAPSEVPEPAFERRDVVRGALYVAWAYATGISVARVAKFPPPAFKATVTQVYAQAQEPCGPGARILEIGAGASCASVFESGRFRSGSAVTAVDVTLPDEFTLREAAEAAKQQGFSFRFEQGDATNLQGFADNSFDAVVCSLTLCSVSSADAAVVEVERVLKPKGRFGFVEHVRVGEGDGRPLLGLSQQLLDPLQIVVAHGCHLRRQSDALIIDRFERAGGRVLRSQRMVNEDMWPVSQQAAGVVEKA